MNNTCNYWLQCCGINFYVNIKQLNSEKAVNEFCASKNIEWRFFPERSPHFGGLWEAAVKSMKFHLRRIVDDARS